MDDGPVTVEVAMKLDKEQNKNRNKEEKKGADEEGILCFKVKVDE